MKLRIFTTIISALISSLAGILLYKYYSENNDNIIFIFVSAQQISGFIVIFFLYGAQFEIKEKMMIKSWNIIIISALLIPFFPILSLSCLFISRVALQKFGKLDCSGQIYKIIYILFILFILLCFNSNWLLLVVAFFPLIPMLLIGESSFEAPNIFFINWKNLKAIFLRSSLDLSLLFPMILINIFTKYLLTQEDYIEVQKIIFCLSGLAIINTILEKIIFDKNISNSYNLNVVRNNSIILLFTYIGVGAISYLISVDLKYWWYLTIAPFLNFLFTNLLAKKRSNLSIQECLIVSLKYMLSTFLIVILSFTLVFYEFHPINSILLSMILLTLFQFSALVSVEKAK